jgi:hypothetical protein
VSPIMNIHSKQHEFDVRWGWADRINTAWQQSVTGILEVGRLLIDAKAELGYGDFGAMFEAGEVKFSIRTAEYLMDIGRDERLNNPKYISHLPPHWATLKELTKVTGDVFEAAVDDKLIHPGMSCADAKKLQRPAQKPRREADLEKQYLRMIAVMNDVRDAPVET